MTLHGVLVPAGSLCLLAFKQLCNAGNTWHHHCSSTHESKILRTWVTMDGTFMTACYIGPGMCFGSSPLPPYTHSKEKSIGMFGSKIWMLNMLSKTHFKQLHHAKEEKS